MPSSFKGTEVSLQKIVLEGKATGAVLAVDVRFEDKNGIVHAITRHQLETTADQKIALASKALYEAIKAWIEAAHFDDPASTSTTPTTERVTPRGIAESVRGATDSADDSVGQG